MVKEMIKQEDDDDDCVAVRCATASGFILLVLVVDTVFIRNIIAVYRREDKVIDSWLLLMVHSCSTIMSIGLCGTAGAGFHGGKHTRVQLRSSLYTDFRDLISDLISFGIIKSPLI